MSNYAYTIKSGRVNSLIAIEFYVCLHKSLSLRIKVSYDEF
jgi:hypothetical protein